MPEDGDMDEEPQGMDEFDWVMKVVVIALPTIVISKAISTVIVDINIICVSITSVVVGIVIRRL